MGSTLLHFHRGIPEEEKELIGLERMANFLSNKSGKKITCTSLKEGFFDKWMTVMPRRVTELAEFPIEDYLNPFLKNYGIALTQDEMIEAMDIQASEFQKSLWVEDGVIDLLKFLKTKKYKIGVISNSCVYDEVNINHFKATQLFSYIDGFTFSYYLKVRKPRPEIFLTALQRLSASPETSLMIGDSLPADVQGSQNLGMRGIWYNPERKVNNSQIVPYATIEMLKDLKQLF